MAELRLTFLGTGTSQGVPMIGCDCHVCRSTDRRDNRTRASVHVATPGCAWVIDTGPDFRMQCLREHIDRVEAVVYTHPHTDHIMGFDDLRPFCRGGGDLPIYASAETMGHLQRAFEFAFNGQNRWPGYVHPEPRVIQGPFTLGELELTPLPIPHGRFTVNGYLLSHHGTKLVAYLSDCHDVPASVIDQIHGVRHMIIDALRERPHPTHLSHAQAMEIAARVQPGTTWFTHLCHDHAHAEILAKLPAGIQVAYDGLQIHEPLA